MNELLFTLDPGDKDCLGTERCIQGLQVAANAELVYLRGIYENSGIDVKIKQLPARQTYTINEADLLFLPGKVTPVGKLPALEWKPIADFISVAMPVTALPGETGKKVPIRIIATEIMQRGDALMLALDTWKAYAEAAPAVRLAQLRFAVSDNNEVLIMGHPLPPLPGREYWLRDNMLIPNGYRFEIPLAGTFLSARQNPNDDGFLLFDKAGNWQKIYHSFFVPAARTAIRLTTGAKQANRANE
jgi:hypothetical protein